MNTLHHLSRRINRRCLSTAVAHLGKYPQRTQTCNQLGEAAINQPVHLCGWLVHNRTVSKNLGFFVLQDAHGQVQLLARAKKSSEENGVGNSKCLDPLSVLNELSLQSVVQVSGQVRRRIPSAVTPGVNGTIEVIVDSVLPLNPAEEKLPFSPNDEINLPNEEFRLRHRHLDLRRPSLALNLKRRSDVAHSVRNLLHNRGFVEVETPVLLKSTPEGAREYLVPTRLSKVADATSFSNEVSTPESSGSRQASSQPLFYALSQSPQQPKQILVCSGAVEKYYQFARCFRDEDGRADRQPEFTQIDLEMAWPSWSPPETARSASTENYSWMGSKDSHVNWHFSPWNMGGWEVKETVEAIMCEIWEKDLSFPVMQYVNAMKFYGSDKPDLRWNNQLLDIGPLLPEESRTYLSEAGLEVEAFVLPLPVNAEEQGRLDRLLNPEIEVHTIQPGALWNGTSRFFPSTNEKAIAIPKTDEGGIMLLATRPRKPEGGWTSLGRVRHALVPHYATKEELASHRFLWVTEFPLFTRADEDKEFLASGRWSSSHHPFTAPMIEDLHLIEQGGNKLIDVRGQHYDLVLNGMEIAGGSVRIHDANLQEKIFRDVLELSPNETAGFAQLLQVLKSGAPPHAGIAIGFDRLMSILCNERSIRNVIAFPKTAGGIDLLFKSPTPISTQTLALYGLQPTKPVRETS
ncbi:hypothetical protein CPB86DRAFT_803635 [Serendipita vermifera]|nr:hypothetical protein CPB86DRAFT_803635 [Serendipita vermifera]